MVDPYEQPEWLISERDFRLHAFHHLKDSPTGDLAALCDHTIPPDKIVPRENTALTPPHCNRCLSKHAEQLADLSGIAEKWQD